MGRALRIGYATPGTYDLSIADAEGDEGDSGTTTFNHDVTIDVTQPYDVLFDYATSDNTGTAGDDYVAASGTGRILAGETSATISVTVNGDTDVEDDEVYDIDISNFRPA